MPPFTTCVPEQSSSIIFGNVVCPSFCCVCGVGGGTRPAWPRTRTMQARMRDAVVGIAWQEVERGSSAASRSKLRSLRTAAWSVEKGAEDRASTHRGEGFLPRRAFGTAGHRRSRRYRCRRGGCSVAARGRHGGGGFCGVATCTLRSLAQSPQRLRGHGRAAALARCFLGERGRERER